MEIMERKRYRITIKKIIIDIIVLLLLILAAEGVIHQFKSSIFRAGGRVELALGLSERNGGVSLNAGDISVLENNTGNRAVAYSGEMQGTAGYEGKYERVCILASNEHVLNYYPYKIIKGNFLIKWHCDNGSRVAVIGKNLAARLFMSCDVIGCGMYINGSLYRIAGVYDEIITPVTLFSLDGAERVFIPIASIDEYSGIPISNIFVKGDGGGGGSGGSSDGSDGGGGDGKGNGVSSGGNNGGVYNLDYFVGHMGEKYYSKLKGYNIKDYTRSTEFILQFMKFDFFIIGLSFIILFLRGLISVVKAFYLEMKESLADSYLPELLKKQKKAIFLRIIKIASLLAGIFFIYSMVRFTPFLPEKYIPEDNLFDLGFYLDKFTEYIRTENNPDFPDSVYNTCCKTSLTYVLSLSLFILLQWLKVLRGIVGFIENKAFQKN